ncbi:MAG: HU family DNA-binding protein [Bacteroidaceae bacterium]|nr:HU family DNA-binding protein [Prevotella sp.]MDE5998704.1 HU family DNA-binding protein [Bacteroidaceae bacterium]
MGLQYRKAQVTLNYREAKPKMYKAVQLTYPQVTYEQLVEEVAQSRGVNTNMTRNVVDALLNRLVHYMEIGHGVSLGTFGSFKPVFTSKVAQSYDEVEDTVTGKNASLKKKVRFYPGGQFQKMLRSMSVTGASDALDVAEKGEVF